MTPADVTMVWPMPTDDAQRDMLRAGTTPARCGYLGTNLTISTRTANETAAVVTAMNSLLGS